MSNAVFPVLPGLAWPVKRTPIWSTTVQKATSGKETRIGHWSYPIWEYEISYEVLRQQGLLAELTILSSFYNAMRGSYDDWLYSDPDNKIADNVVFAQGDGESDTFQLARSIGAFLEPVRGVKVINEIAIEGSPTIGYTADVDRGTITFNDVPDAGQDLSWSGEYYWRCRFSEDDIDFVQFATGFYYTNTIKFRSLK